MAMLDVCLCLRLTPVRYLGVCGVARCLNPNPFYPFLDRVNSPFCNRSKYPMLAGVSPADGKLDDDGSKT